MRYIALDIHSSSTVMCVKDAAGLVLERKILPTNKTALQTAVRRVRAPRAVIFEEGTLAAWAYTVLTPHATKVVVCDPRENRLLRSGAKNDHFDAEKLAELLRLGAIRPVFHEGAYGERLRIFANHYEAVTVDVMRVKLRLRAVFRAVAVPTDGSAFFNRRHRRRYLNALRRYPTHRARAEALFAQLDALAPIATDAREQLVTAAAEDPAFLLLQSIPYVAGIRAAILLATIVTPRRFPNCRKFWAYAGCAVAVRTSGEYAFHDGEVARVAPNTGGRRMKKCCRPLRRVLTDVARAASNGRGVFRDVFEYHVGRGLRRAAARHALARHVASVVLAVWRSMRPFDPALLKNSSRRPEGPSARSVARSRLSVARLVP